MKDYQTNQSLKNQALSDIETFLKDNKAEKELIKELEFLDEYILDLECEIELNKTLAEEERKTIKEKIHHEEY